MQRVDTPEEERKDFFLYVDEFQNFATESFVNVLSEARKYRLDLILGHQYITQMDETVRDAVFGNVGTLVSFRVGAEDAEFLEREFIPDFIAQDLVNLGKYNVYVKLMIDGIAGRPFSAETLPPFPVNKDSDPEKIIKVSRERYGTPRTIVEEKISKWAQAINSGTEKPSFNQGFGTVLYDAKCVKCGKDTKVIFPPDGKRPTYCKSCLKKMKKQNGEEEKREEKAPDQQKISSLEEAIRNGHVPFNPTRREEEEKRRARKEVDRKGLKEMIAESLGRKAKEPDTEGKDISDDAKKGILKPGDSVKF
jgi:CxxC-x17-CxxC domain-containing protein